MYVALYLTLGVALMGGLFWTLTQITARQRRLNAEMIRLERLAAEVSMSAEAVLDKVDERIDQLAALLARAEQTAQGQVEGSAAAPATSQEPGPAPRKRKRSRPRTTPQPAPEHSAAAVAPEAPAVIETPLPTPPPLQKYQDLKTAVRELADQGRTSGDIAEELGLPRGEVQLMLNLGTRKVTA